MPELSEQIQVFIKHVLNYYSLPYINIHIADMGSSIACQGHSTVHASQKVIEEKPDDVVKAIMAHEISHRTLYPGTTVEQETHIVISQMEGIHPNNIGTFLNIVYDLLLDRINLLYRDWSDTYIIGMEDLRPWKFTDRPLSPDTIFNNVFVAIIHDYYHRNYTLGKTEQEVYDLLYKDSRTIESRLVDLAHIFKKWCNNSESGASHRNEDEKSRSNDEEPENEESKNDSDGNENSENDSEHSENGSRTPSDDTSSCGNANKVLPFERNLTPDEIREVAENLAKIYDELKSEIPLDPDLRLEFKKRRAKRIAMPLIKAKEHATSRVLVPSGQWSPCNAIHELDLIRTISTHGIMIPELTTQRTAEVEAPGHSIEGARPHVIILADVSGSMKTGNAIERLIDVIIAINMISKKKNWPITLVKFNAGTNILTEKCRDYALIDDLAARLYAGGDTNINGAIRIAEKFGSGLAVFIMTDQSNISLLQEKTYSALKRIKQNKNEIFLYCIGQEFHKDFKEAIKPVVTKAFSIPHHQPYMESIISNAMDL